MDGVCEPDNTVEKHDAVCQPRDSLEVRRDNRLINLRVEGNARDQTVKEREFVNPMEMRFELHELILARGASSCGALRSNPYFLTIPLQTPVYEYDILRGKNSGQPTVLPPSIHLQSSPLAFYKLNA